MSTKRTDRGMTLIEVIIASVILGMVILITLDLLNNATDTQEKIVTTMTLEDGGRKFCDIMEDELLAARFTGQAITVNGVSIPMGIYTNNTEIRFQIPSSEAGTGYNNWGYTSPLNAPNGGLQDGLACIIRFEADETIRESSAAGFAVVPAYSGGIPTPTNVLADTVLDSDINRDGDMNDTYVRGSIHKYVIAGDGTPLAGVKGSPVLEGTKIMNNVILMVTAGNASVWTGDCNDDGTSDPLLRFVDIAGNEVTTNISANAVGVVVDVWTGNWDRLKKGALIRQNTATIKFRNQQ